MPNSKLYLKRWRTAVFIKFKESSDSSRSRKQVIHWISLHICNSGTGNSWSSTAKRCTITHCISSLFTILSSSLLSPNRYCIIITATGRSLVLSTSLSGYHPFQWAAVKWSYLEPEFTGPQELSTYHCSTMILPEINWWVLKESTRFGWNNDDLFSDKSGMAPRYN